MKSEEELLAECRAHWEATKPEAVFADYWLGWKAARETIVVDLPAPHSDYSISDSDINGACAQWRRDVNAVKSIGLVVKS